VRVLALVPYVHDTAPGQRFRIEQWEPELRAQGVELTFEPFEDEAMHEVMFSTGSSGSSSSLSSKVAAVGRAMGRRVRRLRRLGDFDAAYVFREASLLGPPVFERWLHRAGLPYVFDFDDATWLPPPGSSLSALKYPQKTRTLCRLAASVMAGNPYLASYARRFNDNVAYVPTTIDLSTYTLRSVGRSADEPVVIGWSGSTSTVAYLEGLRPALTRLARDRQFRLRVIGTPRFDLPGVDVCATPWRSATEVEDLRDIDIGLMPLPDDPWARGKCALKALQYMALGIPAVCSPVGVNADIVRDGDNGFLASTDDEWVDRLSRLLDDASLRASIGAAGRRTVEEDFDGRVQARRVAEIFRGSARLDRGGPGGREVALHLDGLEG